MNERARVGSNNLHSRQCGDRKIAEYGTFSVSLDSLPAPASAAVGELIVGPKKSHQDESRRHRIDRSQAKRDRLSKKLRATPVGG
jgi:hypothetical protein